MATGTVRFLIVLALVAAGAVLIAEFPDASTAPLAGGGTATQAESPSPDGTGGTGNTNTGSGAASTPSAQVKGVKVAVYNGTLETGLAASAAADLVDKYGYKINPETSVLDAEDKPLDKTTIYFVASDDRIEADALADSYFKALDVKIARLPDGSHVPKGVRVAVYLGTDYGQTH